MSAANPLHSTINPAFDFLSSLTGSPSEAGALLHDDLVISAALCALLDEQIWGLAISEIIPGYDPISTLNEVF